MRILIGFSPLTPNTLGQYLAHDSQVDLTEYVEKHEFVFDAVLDEDVSNDEVGLYGTPLLLMVVLYIHAQLLVFIQPTGLS